MIISYKLLQLYFDKKLPKPEVVADALTFHAFEIESIEQKSGDTLIDVKVLPNRAHDCLSHRGVAGEVSAILNIPLKKLPAPKLGKASKTAPALRVEIKDKRCTRYLGLIIDGVKVTPSPKWLKEALESLGQRSINNVVDATNYVMLMIGQPLHAFDYAKVSGSAIIVRPAKEGEQMTTLDKKELTLNPDVMVIADKEGVLGIAGVKGGTKAEVTNETTSIVLESANFDASTIRVTAMKLGIRTDASKRFESGLTPYLAEEAMLMVAGIIVDIADTKETKLGSLVDIFPKPPKARVLTVTLADINRILGTEFADREVSQVWKKLDFMLKTTGKGDAVTYAITIPFTRLDLTLKQDLVEEVGRMMGYHKLIPSMPTDPMKVPEVNKEWQCRDIAREIMLTAGFSEVYTYSFNNVGEVEVANPIANDKKSLRNNLSNGLKGAVSENLKYDSAVCIFEFGHVFGRDKHQLVEESSFAVFMGFAKRKDAQKKEDFFVLKGVLDTILQTLGVPHVHYEEASGELVASVYSGDEVLGVMSVHGFELNFGKIVALANKTIVFTLPSKYPSIIRDISLFVPLATRAGDVEAVIESSMGGLVQSLTLIDVFEQPEEKRKSLAFRMTLQSYERTLSDDEANSVSLAVVTALEKANSTWEVRK